MEFIGTFFNNALSPKVRTLCRCLLSFIKHRILEPDHFLGLLCCCNWASISKARHRFGYSERYHHQVKRQGWTACTLCCQWEKCKGWSIFSPLGSNWVFWTDEMVFKAGFQGYRTCAPIRSAQRKCFRLGFDNECLMMRFWDCII